MTEIDELREWLIYDPQTGSIYSKRTGKTVGSLNWKGYQVVTAKTRHAGWKTYKAHRLAFVLMLGRWPRDQVDHVNQDKADNRWSNLREATNAQNNGNRKLLRNNTSGARGVHWHKPDRAWRAELKINGRKKYLGQFKNKADAEKAYNVAAQRHFGNFYHHDLIG